MSAFAVLLLSAPLLASPGVPSTLAMRVSTSTPIALEVPLDTPAADRLRRRSTYDGRGPEEKPWLEPWPVTHSLRIVNGQLRSFSLKDPTRELELELGQLGVAGRSPLVGVSPYVLLRKSWEYEGALDATAKVQGGVVGLNARFFYDDAPGLDARADAGLDAAADLAGSLGGQLTLDPETLKEARGWFEYRKTYDSTTMAFASALGQVGKTVSLPGPFDAGFVAGGLVRYAWRFPNAALDQTGAVRLRITPDLSLGAFAGVTEALGFVNKGFWKETLDNEDFDAHTHLDLAPHFSGALWGSIPRLNGAEFTVEGGHQINPMTGVTHARAGFLFPTRVGSFSVGGRFEREAGADIEFERIKGGADLGYSPAPGVEAYASYAHEDISFGGVGMKNDLFFVGFRGSDAAGVHPQSLSIEAVLDGKDRLALSPSGALAVLDETARLAALLEGVAMIRERKIDQGWARIRELYWALDPAMRDAVDALFKEKYPDLGLGLGIIIFIDPSNLPADVLADLLRDLENKIPTELKNVTADQVAKVAEFLGTPAVYERLLIRYARHRALEELEKKPIDLYGQSVQLSAPTVLALAHIHGLSLSPIPPMTERDAREGLDPLLFRKLKELSGVCPEAGGEGDFAKCVVGLLPADQAEILTKIYGDRLGPMLTQAIQWHADVLRREINRTILEILLAAEALNDLSVDRGTRIGELDTAWLIASFRKMDKPARREWGKVLSRARAGVADDLKAQEKALKATLSSYGAARLSELNSGAGARVEIAPEDLPPLLAFFGDRELFAFIIEARSRLKPGQTLTVGFHSMPDMGVMGSRDDKGVTVRLPPLTGTATPKRVLALALDAAAP